MTAEVVELRRRRAAEAGVSVSTAYRWRVEATTDVARALIRVRRKLDAGRPTDETEAAIRALAEALVERVMFARRLAPTGRCGRCGAVTAVDGALP